MTHLQGILSPGTASALITTLLHSLWQGAIAALALYAALKTLPARRANLRYAASVLALAAMLVAALVTWDLVSRPSPSPSAPAAVSPGYTGGTNPVVAASDKAPSAPSRPGTPTLRDSAMTLAERVSPWLAVLWAFGVAIMLLRAALALRGASSLRKAALPLSDGAIPALADEVRRAIGLTRRVRIAACEAVLSPSVVGILEPLVLMPPAMLAGMPVGHLRAVLAHELAHVRRYDCLVNLIQLVVEALGFFNPAVWWTSRQIRIEREACCDAVAARVTGEPEAVAKTLADWAEAVARARTATVAMALASGREGGLASRIRRLAFPSDRPSIRFSWATLSATLVVSVLALAVLTRTVGVAVETAERLLTPQERMDKLAQISETHGAVPEYRMVSRDASDNATITGAVRTWDGKPLPQGAQLYEAWASGNPDSPAGVNAWRQPQDLPPDGKYKVRAPHAEIRITVTAPGYAPAFAPPQKRAAGEVAEGVDLVLTEGFTGRVKLTDERGAGLAGVKVAGIYDMPGKVPVSDAVSDSDGVVALEHLGERPLRLTASAAGFEEEERRFELAGGAVTVWQLTGTKPTTGTVVSAADGKPIEGATFSLNARFGNRRSGDMMYDSEWAPLWATSDKDGHFEFGSLRAQTRYSFWVEAPGFARSLICRVGPGQSDIAVKLAPEVVVRGRIVGPAGSLGRGRQSVDYEQDFMLEDASYGTVLSAPLEIRDGVGHFEIHNLHTGLLTVDFARQKSVTVTLAKSVDDLVIDLTPPSPASPSRERTVQLRFVVPQGAPEPQGTVAASFMSKDRTSVFANYLKEQPSVEEGRAEVKVAAPGKLSIASEGMVGYWFKQNAIDVPLGDAPLTVDVPCIPAGSIYGTILGADGKPIEIVGGGDVMMSVVAVTPSPAAGTNDLGIDEVARKPGGKFMAGPLPLGGTYVIIAHRGASFALSEPLPLDEKTPAREVALTFPAGVKLEIELQTPEGAPAANMPVRLSYATPYSRTYMSLEGDTDDKGRVSFAGVNPDAPGGYSLVLLSHKDYREETASFDARKSPVVVRLERGKALDGTVVNDADGTGVPGVTLVAVARTSGERTSYEDLEAEGPTDARGRFRFSNMADREYRLYVRERDAVREYSFTPGAAPAEIRVKAPSPEASR